MSSVDEPRSAEVLVAEDLFSMSDDELRALIGELIARRSKNMQNVIVGVSMINEQLQFAHFELASRASDRVARRALWIAVLSIVISAAGTVIPLIT